MVFITYGVFPLCQYPRKRNDTFRSNRANQEESDSYHFLFLFRIPYISEEKQGSEPVCHKRNGKFRSDRSEETKIDLSIWLPTEISGIFGVMENTRGLLVLVHCSMASEVMESFLFFFFISTNQADIIGRTFFPSCFLVAASEINGSVVTAWHKLTARI